MLATAASLHDDTAVVDEIAALREEYRDDLDIQVVGIEQLRDAEPTVAAEARRAIADQLQASGYPGHGDIFRHRAGEDLRSAGDSAGAFDLFWQLGFDSLLRGDTQRACLNSPTGTCRPTRSGRPSSRC